MDILDGINAILTPFKALKNTLEALVAIEKGYGYLCDRMVFIGEAVDKIRVHPGFQGLGGDRLTWLKMGGKLASARDLIAKIKDMEENPSQSPLTRAKRVAEKWIGARKVHARLKEVQGFLDTVVAGLTLAQVLATGVTVAELSNNVEQIRCVLDRGWKQGQGEPQGEFRYNKNILEFLRTQIAPVKQLKSSTSSQPAEMSADDWQRSLEAVDQTLKLAEVLMERHCTPFDLQTFYRVSEARRGVEMICGNLAAFCAALGSPSAVQERIPDDLVAADRRDLHRRLDFVLNGGEMEGGPTGEWEVVRRQHEARVAGLQVVENSHSDLQFESLGHIAGKI
ncbi:unnamed protein product [Ostreobium quekettii]|uniref:Uncharacterized protein n=1 Tax=Ostreobium quekettii TaxID=121088 RepID=A0A8S1JBT8_9CHLO|nr:unnamed protein product [Ostreobium quekettii]